ncbi:site-specific DNA-methyltransferase [Bacillus sp. JJ1566]|uniref:DNA-methyltransferase n=1 Tax=Bacillus sp. JJ1566 TaxID=3122961 RepID=UPI002FFE5A86
MNVISNCESIIHMSKDIILIQEDCLKALKLIESNSIDLIFADPPYFLSNGGITFKSGRIACVNKGDWDKAKSQKEIDEFNLSWLTECKRILKGNGTIWITGTYHNIFSVGKALTYLKYKILNNVVWVKTNPPKNISKRMFTHSSEIIIWAKQNPSSQHTFNYEEMLKLNKGKQMTDVWLIDSVGYSEKKYGYHPTQKPLKLLDRILLSSTKKNHIVLDPFCGSGTTGVVAKKLGRKFIGIDQNMDYINLAKNRILDKH